MPKLQKKYKFAVIAVDVVIFTIINERLQVLLMKMTKKPFLDSFACPGGLIKPTETADSAAGRHLATKAGVRNVYLEQLYTFSKVKRDPFGRVVSVAYFALAPSNKVKIEATEKTAEIRWCPVDKLPKLAYDHQEMVDYAVRCLKAKVASTNIVYSLLPQQFSLSQLQRIYEIILKKTLDKRNFRKKILLLNLVEKTGKKERGVANRPAELYQFTQRKPRVVEIL